MAPRLPGGAEQAGKRSRGEAIAAESPAPPEAGPATGLQPPAGAAERFKKTGWYVSRSVAQSRYISRAQG